MKHRAKAHIGGIVQGVGFRPFVFRLAKRYGLSGHVLNSSEGVDLEVEGLRQDIDRFFTEIEQAPPPLARVASLERCDIPCCGDEDFVIGRSVFHDERRTLISPDTAACGECLAEMMDPSDRRYRYPFINCTNCGPRYTIIKDVPYDRPNTTMSRFVMCPACRHEYEDPCSRRFHAQPISCWHCGPRLLLRGAGGEEVIVPDPVSEAVSLLMSGAILAVKGLGGFHLACDAGNHAAVSRLRSRKHREEKPFAIMVRDIPAARGIARVNRGEARVLASPERPIVLVPKRRDHGLSDQVAPRNRLFGVMLPYTPLHHLLVRENFAALVMTSGNRSEEPINIDNRSAMEHLRGIADYFLEHDRDIYLRSDDSIVRMISGRARQIRRSRGFVPVPVTLPDAVGDLPPVLAVGGELKNTVCLTKGKNAFVSQHIGDMENFETLEFFQRTVSHLSRILDVRPKVLAHDLHPDYMSTSFAREREGLDRVAIQHHHAHIVSCLAEHGIEGPVIGLAMDGAGFGADGTVWGGEILLADWVSYERVGHLDCVHLPGGDAAARNPWRMGLAYLYKVYGRGLFELPMPFVRNLAATEAQVVTRMLERNVRAPLTSSCGRLFDAVAAMVGLRQRTSYEGQAAMELEMCQSGGRPPGYPWELMRRGDAWVLDTSPMIRSLVGDLCERRPAGLVSRRFHLGLISALGGVCERVREESGVSAVAMSGGVFQNATLVRGLSRQLKRKGFKVFTHARLPANDGCLSLGQAVCAGLLASGWKGRYGSGGWRGDENPVFSPVGRTAVSVRLQSEVPSP